MKKIMGLLANRSFSFKKLSDFTPVFDDSVRLGNRTYRAWSQNPHPPQVIRRGSEAVVTYGDVQTFRLQDDVYDPKRKLKDMDEAGVDMALLSTNIPPPCMLAPELGNKGAQAINDAIAELVDAHPHRFAGLACLPWQNPDEAITENRSSEGTRFSRDNALLPYRRKTGRRATL